MPGVGYKGQVSAGSREAGSYRAEAELELGFGNVEGDGVLVAHEPLEPLGGE